MTTIDTTTEAEPVEAGPEAVDGQTFTLVDGQAVDQLDDEPKTTDRQIIAEWLRDRDQLSDHTADTLSRWAHTTAFHLVRVPLYFLRLVGTAPFGAFRVGSGWLHWVRDLDYLEDRKAAAAAKGDMAKLREGHDQRVRTRVVCSVSMGAPALLALVMGVLFYRLHTVALGAVLVLLLGWIGRPMRSKPIIERVIYQGHHAPPFTEGLMMQALRGSGAEPKSARSIQIIQPPAKTKTGWEAIVVLGVDAEIVLGNARTFATIAGRPANCIFLTTDPDESAGWLRIIVTRRSLRNMKVPPSPLLDSGYTFDYFSSSVPVGVDEQGELVSARKRFTSTAYGGIMGSGKTVSMLNSVLAQCCDPRLELHMIDAKGGTDWEPLAAIAHFFRAGSDQADFQAMEADLQALNKRMDKRFETLRNLPDDIKSPKTNTALASLKRYDLHPILVVIDETQDLFEFAENKKELIALVTRIIKKGRAVAMTVEAGTQEVNKQTLPFASLCAWAYCMMVRGHKDVDQVLGTGSYSMGYHADELSPEDAGIGYFGAGKTKAICKAFYVDPDAGQVAEIADRLHADRLRRGLLTGMAVGDIEPDENTESMLDRVVRLWPASATALQWVELVDILADEMPEDYPTVGDISAGIPAEVARAVDTISSQLGRFGVSSRDVRSKFCPRPRQSSSVRKGVALDDLAAALAGQDRTTEDAADIWTPDITEATPLEVADDDLSEVAA